MTRQSMIALGVALVLGLLAVYFANVFLAGKEQKVVQTGTTRVAVAAVPLSYGVDITPDKIRFVDFPNSSIPAGAFTNAEQLIGKRRVALLPISINEPILSNKISAEGQGASIASLLPDGMRATTIRTNEVAGVAGFIQPNDSVDVLITRSITSEAGQSAQVTDVLLQNVHVLAIDQNAKNADGTPAVARTATVEVTPLDAQKLALAQQVGSLSLVLRKPGAEQNDPVVETVSMNDLRYNVYGGARYPAPAVVGGYGGGLGGATAGAISRAASQVSAASGGRSSAPRKPAAAKPKKPSNNVEIYRGTKSDQYEVGG